MLCPITFSAQETLHNTPGTCHSEKPPQCSPQAGNAPNLPVPFHCIPVTRTYPLTMVGKYVFLTFSFLVKFCVYNLQLFCGCLQKQSNHRCFQWNWQHLDPHSVQNSVGQCPHHLFPKSVQWNIFNQFSHGTNMNNSRHLHELLTFPTTLEKSYFLKASSQRWACSSVGITYRIPLWGTHPAVLIISLILLTPRRETCLVLFPILRCLSFTRRLSCNTFSAKILRKYNG